MDGKDIPCAHIAPYPCSHHRLTDLLNCTSFQMPKPPPGPKPFELSRSYPKHHIRQPLFFLDVHVQGHERPLRLPVFKGDNPSVLATEFASEHRLGFKACQTLENLIREQLTFHFNDMQTS